MIYREFKGKKLSFLGFGAMRFPTLELDGKKTVDLALTEKMIDEAIAEGVNYFDTAWPYHGGESERILGKLLSKYPRESYFIADKFPGHQIMESYDVEGIFEEQLRRLRTDYIDFYLLHNVYENSMETYLDPKHGILDYLLEQKRLGRIKHLGFSAHADVEGLKSFLDTAGEYMEFCQIQLNYLDWTLQRAKEKCELLNSYGIPIWVMEPVRGGKLANLPEAAEAKLRQVAKCGSAASYGFRFLMDIPGVTVVLSGMSSLEQVKDNLRTCESEAPLSADVRSVLLEIAEGMKKSVPCTHCGYCKEGCPMELDIPALISVYNEVSFSDSVNSAMRVEFLPEEKKPAACIACGKCSSICPQNIDIPKTLRALTARLGEIPSWKDICRERDKEQKENAAK